MVCISGSWKYAIPTKLFIQVIYLTSQFYCIIFMVAEDWEDTSSGLARLSQGGGGETTAQIVPTNLLMRALLLQAALIPTHKFRQFYICESLVEFLA